MNEPDDPKDKASPESEEEADAKAILLRRREFVIASLAGLVAGVEACKNPFVGEAPAPSTTTVPPVTPPVAPTPCLEIAPTPCLDVGPTHTLPQACLKVAVPTPPPPPPPDAGVTPYPCLRPPRWPSPPLPCLSPPRPPPHPCLRMAPRPHPNPCLNLKPANDEDDEE